MEALIIDDNRKLADVMGMMLEVLGFSWRVAYGSRSGLMSLEEKLPDVVFLDLNMPGVDGFEVLSYIRRMPGCEDLPVIVVTSDDQTITARKVKQLGAAKLIVKPATVDILENVLKRLELL